MSQSGTPGVPGIPIRYDTTIITASGTGVINPGDWLQYSGQFALVGFSGQASTAYFKASGAGVALESNPVYDPLGRAIQNSALKILTQGILHVSASFSGQPALGLAAYPDASGSGVFAPTGVSGVGATWNTAVPLSNSAMSGTANPRHPGIATVIGSRNFTNGGTGELVLLLVPVAPDIRG